MVHLTFGVMMIEVGMLESILTNVGCTIFLFNRSHVGLRDVFGMPSGCVRDVFGMCSGEIGFTCDRGLYAPDSLRKSSAPELC